jgi:ParB family chromosome partitioning protein
MWLEHERLAEQITEDSCKDEIVSFLKHGQLIPVLGRLIKGDQQFDIELIYGARRLFVARHINVPLRVEVRGLSDREGIIALDMENRQRKDLSPYERGLSFVSWLRAGYFESQVDIARILNISPAQVSRLIGLARLPSVVVAAFESPLDIRETWGLSLSDTWQKQDSRRAMAQAARAIAAESPRLDPAKVYARLLSTGLRSRATTHDEVVKDSSGKALFRVRHHRNDVALLLPAADLSKRSLARIKALVADVLQDAIVQVTLQEGKMSKSLPMVAAVSVMPFRAGQEGP